MTRPMQFRIKQRYYFEPFSKVLNNFILKNGKIVSHTIEYNNLLKQFSSDTVSTRNCVLAIMIRN